MRRANLLARLFRALSGETQKSFGERTGVHPSLLALYELDDTDPGPENLARLAQGAGLTLAAGEELLALAETLRQPRQRLGHETEDLVGRLTSLVAGVSRRLLTLPLPEDPPATDDRHRTGELWRLLADLSEEQQLALVKVAREFRTWPLAERVAEESAVEASRDLARGAGLVRVAKEIAQRARGSEAWCSRLRGLVEGHSANVQRVGGKLKAARATLEEAKRLWHAGSDPEKLLDPGRLLDLEASLCRDERHFEAALAFLEAARKVSRCPARILINKGFTLEVMGEYESAIGALREADSLIDREADPRLFYMQRFNLAVNATHLGQYALAGELVREVRAIAAGRGDENELIRVTWLEGRIAAGLGRQEEALALLGTARRRFAEKGMGYDVALALLEEAALLLQEGHTAEVRLLAEELREVFAAKGVHREALAALRLFQEAAGRETATAELARRLLAYLFRARHDQGLRLADL